MRTRMNDTHSEVILAGVGQTPVGEFWDISLRSLAARAILAAIKDSGGIKPEVMYIGNMLASSASQQANLGATLEMPMAVGTVGGATRVHPAAQACLRLMGVKSARELAEVIVSVGLAQNLAALRALATEGIQKGHMSLHARQVAVAAGAKGEQIEELAERLVADEVIRIDHAQAILKEWSL